MSEEGGRPRAPWPGAALPELVQPQGLTPPPEGPEHFDRLVPAADAIVAAAYGRTREGYARTPKRRSQGGDVLALAPGDQRARALDFRVEGIAWRAGVAPELRLSPPGLVLGLVPPLAHPVLGPMGAELRPVEGELVAVLRDLLPPALLKASEDSFGRAKGPVQAALYYLPQGPRALAGMLAWYEGSVAGPKPHLLYLQTEVQRADARILDEMHATFRASLIARSQYAEAPRPFDFWEEVHEATAEVEASWRAAWWEGPGPRLADEAKGRWAQIEALASRWLGERGGSAIHRMRQGLLEGPQRLLAWAVKGLARALVWSLDALRRRFPEAGPTAPPPGWPPPEG